MIEKLYENTLLAEQKTTVLNRVSTERPIKFNLLPNEPYKLVQTSNFMKSVILPYVLKEKQRQIDENKSELTLALSAPGKEFKSLDFLNLKVDYQGANAEGLPNESWSSISLKVGAGLLMGSGMAYAAIKAYQYFQSKVRKTEKKTPLSKNASKILVPLKEIAKNLKS